MSVEYRDAIRLPGYRVGNDGTVWSCRIRGNRGGIGTEWRQLKATAKQPWGYMEVGVMQDGKRIDRLVHRLVLEAFVGPRPEGMECRHLDGNPANNATWNIEWGTSVENSADQATHGTRDFGEHHGRSKLTDAYVAEAIQLRKSGEWSYRQLAAKYGVTMHAVRCAVLGITWKHIHATA